MTTRYRKAVTELANVLKMGDLEIADFYNREFYQSVPGPIYKHIKDVEAARLLKALALKIEDREMRRRPQ